MRKILVILTLALCASCGPALLKGPHIAKDAEIEDTPEHREILGVVERYRVAMENRDLNTLLAMASKAYYEQAGTTATDDDYGYDGLEKILKERFSKLKVLRLKLNVFHVAVNGDRATVDYNYHGRFLVQGATKSTWAQKVWEARLRLAKQEGRWWVISGM
jgi:hypothetical protein